MAFEPGVTPPRRRFLLGPLLDRAGVVASSLCALHCAATPALLAAAPAAGVVFGDPRWEMPFLFASCALGAAALVPGFLRSGRAAALVVFVAGAALAFFGKLSFEAGGAAEGALSAVGAAGIAFAHLLNLRAARGRAPAPGGQAGGPFEGAYAGRDGAACGAGCGRAPGAL